MSKGTVLCRYYLSGACKFGSSCQFSHSLDDAESQVCRFYLKGECAYGDRCRYLHTKPEWSARGKAAAAGGSSGGYAPPSLRPSADDLTHQLPISSLRLGGRAPDRGLSAQAAALPSQPFECAQGDTDEEDLEALEAFEAAAAACEAYEWEQMLAQQGGPGADYAAYEQWLGEHGQAVGEGGDEGYYDEEGYWHGDDGGYYGEGGHEGGYEEQQEQQQYWEQPPKEQAGAAPAPAAANGGGSGSAGVASSAGAPVPAISVPTPWALPEEGGEDEEDWLQASAGALLAAQHPALRSLCMQWFASGACSRGEHCQLVHGNLCEYCGKHALHPADAEAREQHTAECRLRHERLAARAQSAGVECGVCLEQVLGKAAPGDRRFGLLTSCDHPFCLRCIRSWRQKTDAGADVESALRTCPLCRTTSHYIVPSLVWPSSAEEKERIVAGYKAKLSTIDCRFFSFGEGTCPFSTSCFYRHAYPDGRLEEKTLRKAADEEGNVRVVQPVRLSDFIAVSAAGRRLEGAARQQ